MLDRSRGGPAPAWLPFLGALIALAIGGWLTYAGIDLARNGCDCDEPWYPEWIWVVMIALAASFIAAAVALVIRVIARVRAS